MSNLSKLEAALVAKLAARFGLDLAAARRCAAEVPQSPLMSPPPVPQPQPQQRKRARREKPPTPLPSPLPLLLVVMEQVGTVIASCLDVRGLCRAAPSARAFRDSAADEVARRVHRTALGRTLAARHADEFAMSRLAFCVEICPVAGQYMDLKLQSHTKTLNSLTKNDVWQAGDASAWCRVLLPVNDGFVVYERVEGHYKYTRFPTVRLSLPHVVEMLQPACVEAWALRKPIPREDEIQQCWQQGWAMYSM